MRMRVASEHAGVNSNVLADESQMDPLSGNAVLNGIPVEVRRPGAVARLSASRADASDRSSASSRRSCGR